MGIEMLDLELLKSFVSVVDSGGFTRAGERVHRTQSTVSQQIKRLEEDIGQPLLIRNGKDVTPTEAGERLLSYARRLLSLAEEARGEQDQRRAIGDADLAGDEGEAPEQAEDGDVKRQRIETGAGHGQ